MREERRVGRNHHDDRSVLLRVARDLRLEIDDLEADRNACDPKLLPSSEVRLDQNAERIATLTGANDPGRGASPALQLADDHPGAAADIALRDRPTPRR